MPLLGIYTYKCPKLNAEIPLRNARAMLYKPREPTNAEIPGARRHPLGGHDFIAERIGLLQEAYHPLYTEARLDATVLLPSHSFTVFTAACLGSWHVKMLTWLSCSAAAAIIRRCGWNAVATMAEDRSRRKPE